MAFSLNHIISEIQRKENVISLSAPNAIDEAYQMTIYLKGYLWSIREDITKQGFKNHWEEINFFRNIKPYILSKLIYHNKVFRIQTTCPVDRGKMYASYFLEQLKELKQEYREHIYNPDFYRYNRSGRTDRDETYFRLGNINFHDGCPGPAIFNPADIVPLHGNTAYIRQTAQLAPRSRKESIRIGRCTYTAVPLWGHTIDQCLYTRTCRLNLIGINLVLDALIRD